jgi:hypothetical protein
VIVVRPVLAWYDLWIGAYWNRSHRSLYLLPVPCVGLVLHFGWKKKKAGRKQAGRRRQKARRTW